MTMPLSGTEIRTWLPKPFIMGASAYVFANDAPALVKFFANIARRVGFNVWVCDGTADDVEIQAAIDALPAQGGKVALSSGTFTIAATITINKPTKGVVIEGEGNAITVLKLANGADCNMFEVVATVLPRFAHMVIDGNRTNQTVAKNAFRQTGQVTGEEAVDLTFEDIWFRYWKGDIVYLQAGWDNLFVRCQFEASDAYGIYLYQADKNYNFALTMIKQCFFSGILKGIGGDYLSGDYLTSNVLIENNLFNSVTGICIVPIGQYWTIIGNHFYEIGTAIQPSGFKWCREIIIANNGFFQYSAYAINNTLTNPAVNILIEGNIFEGKATPVTAIVAGQSTRMKIIDNIFRARVTHSGYAIDLSNAACTQAEVKGNTFEGTFTSGIINPCPNVAKVEKNVGYNTEGQIEHHTAADTLTVAEDKSVHTNLGAGGAILIDLPQVVPAGFSVKFAVMTAQQLQIHPGAAGAIYINGAKQTDHKYIWADDEGESVELVADGNGDWIAIGAVGTWGVEA